MKNHNISVYHDRYTTSIVTKYLDNPTVKTSNFFYNTTLWSDIIFTKDGVSTSDEKVEKLTREFNIYFIYCIGSMIYLFSKSVYFSFTVH